MYKVKISNFNLSTIADSGQCFRLNKVDEGTFNLITKDKFLRIKELPNNYYLLSCGKSEFDNYYSFYFDLKSNYVKYIKICNKKDKFLSKCIEYGKGLRILNQDIFETIISFIISQRKSIKAIKTSIEKLCKLSGKKIVNKYGVFYSFPDAKSILKMGKAKLKTCGLGYRTDYIYNFCNAVILNKINFDKLKNLNDEDLLSFLMSFKGIGIKVASCIALFAFHRVSICPKDVWINRVIQNEYNGRIPNAYIKYAGIIQQYWFNYYRLNH